MIKNIVLLAALALCATAYLDPNFRYSFYVYMDQQNLGFPNTATDNGYAVLVYNPGSKTLQYSVSTSIKAGYTSVALYGPVACMIVTNPVVQPNYDGDMTQPRCYQQTGSLQITLGTGPIIDINSVVLSQSQEDMLYIRVASQVFPNGHMAGKIEYSGFGPLPCYGCYVSNQMRFVAQLGPNTGGFPLETQSSSTNIGYAVFTYTYGSGDTNLQFVVYHDIVNPGSASLTCPNAPKPTVMLLATTATSGQFSNINFAGTATTTYVNMIPELFISGNCYVSIASAAFVNGELFGRFYKDGMLEFIAVGSNEVTNPGTNNFVSCMADFDLGTAILGFYCFTNITADPVVTIEVIDGPAGQDSPTVLCSVPGVAYNGLPTAAPTTAPFTSVPPSFFCAVNQSYINDVYNGNIYIQVLTASNPTGSVRGQGTINLAQAGATQSSGGLSQGGKIAIGVVVGLIAFIAIVGVAVFFAHRNGMFNRSRI